MHNHTNRAQAADSDRTHVAAAEAGRAAAAADDVPVTQILELVASANARREGAQMRTDFNVDLLARSLDANARARLGSALQRLLAAGLLTRHSRDEYSLTDAGVRRVAPRRQK